MTIGHRYCTALPTRAHAPVDRAVLLITAFLFAALLCGPVSNAGAAVPWHHGFTQPYGGEIKAGEEEWEQKVTGEMGADTIRLTLSWDHYQTGVNQYSQTALDEIVTKVQRARASSPYPFDPKALITFELPNSNTSPGLKWMNEAGYELTAGEKGSAANSARYYPASEKGQKAYGLAMAKALKYLYSVQIGFAIETPNEPNLKNGPAWAVPAEYIGRLGAFGLAYAAAEGLPVLTPGGPVVLVGSVSTNPGTEYSSEGKTPAQYFRLVQTSTNYWLNSFYLGTENGQATAELLMGTWRASFHSYPKNGEAESQPCQKISTAKGLKTQDELGDLTGVAAEIEARGTRLGPVLEVLSEVPWKKKWWITETGMTAYKTNNPTETKAQCETRRANGGSPYGKGEQKSFYQTLAYNLEVQRIYGSYPWTWFEGLILFAPLDTAYSPTDPSKGFGVFSLGCGNYCWKPAAEYFANTL